MIWMYENVVRLVKGVRGAARDGRCVYARRQQRVPGTILAAGTGAGSDSDVSPRHDSERAEVEAALTAWRGKAADILLAVVAVVQLPIVIVVVLGKGPPMGSVAVSLAVLAWFSIAWAALFRRVALRRRLAVSFAGAALGITVLNLVLPFGPAAQVGLATLPVLVLILVGPREAKMASLGCLVILVFAPWLRQHPAICRAFEIDPAAAAGPPGTIWVRAAELAGFLVGLMVLADRFYDFLREALAGQSQATGKLKQEMQERQALEREIANIGDAERRRLGQELHDGVCQQVTAALLRCQALERQMERGAAPSGADFQTLSSLLGETIDDAHHVAQGLCPLEPDPDALAPALRALTKRAGEMAALRCDFRVAGEVRVSDPGVAQHVYRIAQEALSNAVRHAHANRIRVELLASDGELRLQVHDDGTGLPPEPPGGGMGLRTMAYRARIMGGEFTVRPGPGGGTCVTCRVPVARAGALTTGHHA